MSFQLVMKRGDTTPFLITITDYAGQRIDLTGYTVWLTAKRSVDDSDVNAVFQLSTTNAKIVLSDQTAAATKGQAVAKPAAADTSSLSIDETLFFDVQIRLGTDTFTPVDGIITIVRDITRA